MVRVNIIEPDALSDQHLHAEYNELLMLAGYVIKHPETESLVPDSYRLGRGHILFFRNKLGYLSRRHDALRSEMSSRGFSAAVHFPVSELPAAMMGDWVPTERDSEILKKRVEEKLRMKPDFYRYRRRKCPLEEHLSRLKSAKPF